MRRIHRSDLIAMQIARVMVKVKVMK